MTFYVVVKLHQFSYEVFYFKPAFILAYSAHVTNCFQTKTTSGWVEPFER